MKIDKGKKLGCLNANKPPKQKIQFTNKQPIPTPYIEHKSLLDCNNSPSAFPFQ